MDGDGDLDAFVANDDEANIVWLNDGNGVFTDSGQSLGDSESLGVALGDVDADGDMDAFVADGDDANKVWLNISDPFEASFTNSGQSMSDRNSQEVSLGDLDAFEANDLGEVNKVWFNDGTGTFTSGQTLGSSDSYGVSLGDVDGDGDLDAYVSNYNQNNLIWLNNGAGVFTIFPAYMGSRASMGVTLGDVDGDGDLDAFVVNDSEANIVWLNIGAGAGMFTTSGQSLGSRNSYGVTLSDVDGDLDAFVANRNEGNRVWLNSAFDCVDEDSDGYGYPGTGNCQYSESDCDDTDPAINPGAAELCDGVDNNCDGSIDEEPAASASCDNDLWCDGKEFCYFTTCFEGTAQDCSDEVGCTVDSCNEYTDTCDHVADDGLCDDGLWCNGAETCDEIADCQAGTAPDCTDTVGCTDDSCDEATDSCVQAPNDTLCDDGLWCNGAETCDEVADCQAGTAPDCTDTVGCTDDSCDEATDSCVQAPNDTLCDDGLWCNGAETCDEVEDCQAGTAPDCTDTVECTDDSCDEATDSCVQAPNDTLCDDGLWCNGAETCDETADCQAGTPIDCDDGIFCTGVETCNEDQDQCESSGDPCVDGNDCTEDIYYEEADECNNPCLATGPDHFCCDYPACIDELICAEFTLELDASYSSSYMVLNYTIGTPESATWANYLVLTSPTVQVIPLWTISLPVLQPTYEIPISFPLPSLGWVGIYTGLFTAEGAQAVKLVWVNTG